MPSAWTPSVSLKGKAPPGPGVMKKEQADLWKSIWKPTPEAEKYRNQIQELENQISARSVSQDLDDGCADLPPAHSAQDIRKGFIYYVLAQDRSERGDGSPEGRGLSAR